MDVPNAHSIESTHPVVREVVPRMALPQQDNTAPELKLDVKSNEPTQYEASIEPSEAAITAVPLGWRTWTVVFVSAYLA
jgi:hypothetical protein